ncbi:glycosyltransferase [Spirochaetota bacterium]
MVHENKLDDYIVLTGKVPHNDVLKYYSIIDILIYPRNSIRLTELVTPLKPLEAMAMEKAVIGSDVGGIKELIIEGTSGFLFKSGDVDNLKDRVFKIIDNPKLTWDLQKKARKYVIEKRNWHTIISDYLKIYNSF